MPSFPKDYSFLTSSFAKVRASATAIVADASHPCNGNRKGPLQVRIDLALHGGRAVKEKGRTVDCHQKRALLLILDLQHSCRARLLLCVFTSTYLNRTLSGNINGPSQRIHCPSVTVVPFYYMVACCLLHTR